MSLTMVFNVPFLGYISFGNTAFYDHYISLLFIFYNIMHLSWSWTSSCGYTLWFFPFVLAVGLVDVTASSTKKISSSDSLCALHWHEKCISLGCMYHSTLPFLYVQPSARPCLEMHKWSLMCAIWIGNFFSVFQNFHRLSRSECSVNQRQTCRLVN